MYLVSIMLNLALMEAIAEEISVLVMLYAGTFLFVIILWYAQAHQYSN
jgi:hypothetical protein